MFLDSKSCDTLYRSRIYVNPRQMQFQQNHLWIIGIITENHWKWTVYRKWVVFKSTFEIFRACSFRQGFSCLTKKDRPFYRPFTLTVKYLTRLWQVNVTSLVQSFQINPSSLGCSRTFLMFERVKGVMHMGLSTPP